MFNLAGEELFTLGNVTMLRADALKNKNHLNPAVLAAVTAQLDAAPGRRFKLVANLPFHVATPLLSNLLALDRPPETMTCTIQKELAERIVARCGTKDYGALAIWVQSQCRCQILRVLPPSVFWPRPKVSSAFVQIAIDPAVRGASRTGRSSTTSCARSSVTAASSSAPNCWVPARTGWTRRASTASWPGWDWTARSGPSASTRRPCWPSARRCERRGFQ